MSRTDQHGNPFSGGADAAQLYDQAIHALLRYGPDVLEHAPRLLREHPDVPMAQALMSYLALSSTDAPDVETAKRCWTAMGALTTNDREKAHHKAIGAWVAGDWVGASRALDDLLQRWPSDLLALQLGHQIDFFVGDASNLRDRPGRSLPELDPEHPHTAFVRGMQAFGLEESGDYGAAEASGLAAVETNHDDVWGIHAVVHVREMQGRVDDGIRFLLDRQDDWGAANLFMVHNWWHLALYLLEVGAVSKALEIYDAQVHNAESDGVPLEMIDASALLWRLFLEGHDTGDRFAALANAWENRLGPTSWYVFNDLHAVMALAGAGRIADAEHAVEELAGYVHRDGAGTNVMMASTIGLPASRAALRFAQGRYEEVVAELLPIRRKFQVFGGSHAQRDALVRTLLESAQRSGQHELARALIDERLSLRPSSVYGWTQRARLQQAIGNAAGAAESEERVEKLQASFRAGAGAADWTG
jgi:tetratricopeptide (TPR) repeat protein